MIMLLVRRYPQVFNRAAGLHEVFFTLTSTSHHTLVLCTGAESTAATRKNVGLPGASALAGQGSITHLYSLSSHSQCANRL